MIQISGGQEAENAGVMKSKHHISVASEIQAFHGFVLRIFPHGGLSPYIWRINVPGVYRPALQELSSKLYFCCHKNDLPDAMRRSGQAAVLPPAEEYPGKPRQVAYIMKEKRTRYIKIRMTREEIERIKEKSASYTSVSHFIRSAVAEHSGVGAKQKLELIRELGGFYREFRNDLSHIGGNLNQSVRRANELSAAGLLPPGYITEVLMPAILETQNTLDGIKKELDAITRKAVRL